MIDFNFALPVALGIGLAAATGFRVFLPLLIMSIAANAGYLPLSDGFSWLSTSGALIMLVVAALVEIVAYYIPGVDNLLDSLATPGAIVAGIAVSAAVMTDMPPMVKWTLAIIAGGGTAALTQGATAVIRANSSIFTAGLGNSVVATVELLGALLLSLLALLAPFFGLAFIVVLFLLTIRMAMKFRRPGKPPTA
jgi:hypothetical protein